MSFNWSSILVVASGGETPNPLRFDADLALFTLIIFVGLIFVLGKFAWKPIIEGLNSREKGISDQMEAADKANEQAQATLRQYEEKMASADEEAKEILGEARKDAVAAKEKILSDAQDEAGRLKEKALADIEAAKSEAVRELAEKSVDSAVALAGSIVGRSLDKNDHQKLIDDSVSGFGG